MTVVSGVFAIACGKSDGQPDASMDSLSGVPACAQSLEELFSPARIAAPGPDSDGYRPASASERAALSESIEHLVADRRAAAIERAGAAAYTLCRDGEVFVWEPAERRTGRAVLAWRRTAARPLIIETPHAVYDVMTLEESLTLFDQLGARALIVSGTHRCSNPASGCDGTTGACGEREPYRESDMAHAVDTAFQTAHEAFAAAHPTDWIASIHGMSDVGASLSDGTLLPTDAGAPVALLASALAAELPDENITTCNDYPGGTAVERLCGTTNVQGRHINGSADVCLAEAAMSAHRFVHIEQSSDLRADPTAVVAAFDAVVPAP